MGKAVERHHLGALLTPDLGYAFDHNVHTPRLRRNGPRNDLSSKIRATGPDASSHAPVRPSSDRYTRQASAMRWLSPALSTIALPILSASAITLRPSARRANARSL